jgi:integrase/recombinase XerD
MNPDNHETPQPPDESEKPEAPKPPRRLNGRQGINGAESLRKRVEKGTDNFRAVGHKPLPEDENPASLAHHVRPYLDYLTARNYSPRTVEGCEQSLRRFVIWTIERGIQIASEINLPVIEAYQAWLWRYRKTNGKPIAVSTQRGELLTIKSYFRWLMRQRVILANPASEIELPRPEKRLPPDALTTRQTGVILSVPDTSDPLGVRDRAMLETLYSTALRRGELAKLRVEDLNIERSTIRVNKGKGNKDRVVPVGTRALHWLTRYLEEVRPRLAIRQEVRELFLNGLGIGFSSKGLGQSLSKILRRADIAKGGPHLLRHTCATHMLEGGADLRHIQALLGHATADTTSLYAQVSITHLQAVHARCHPAERTGPNSTGKDASNEPPADQNPPADNLEAER